MYNFGKQVGNELLLNGRLSLHGRFWEDGILDGKVHFKKLC
jgi:hypothetical protein